MVLQEETCWWEQYYQDTEAQKYVHRESWKMPGGNGGWINIHHCHIGGGISLQCYEMQNNMGASTQPRLTLTITGGFLLIKKKMILLAVQAQRILFVSQKFSFRSFSALLSYHISFSSESTFFGRNCIVLNFLGNKFPFPLYQNLTF